MHSGSGRARRASEILSKRPALPVTEMAKEERDFVIQPMQTNGRTMMFDDPITLIEIVEMLIKLHRASLRFKILTII